jgi:predicted nucleic acid-binding protein
MRVTMDTGPWVALVDRSESRHGECVEWLKQFEGEIFTSEAVLTEVLYLLNFSSKAQSAAFDFILTGAIVLVPSSIESLKMAKRLMKKYQDLPMDFADATLASLAHDLSIDHIVTFDRKDFSIYRLHKKRSFIVVP